MKFITNSVFSLFLLAASVIATAAPQTTSLSNIDPTQVTKCYTQDCQAAVQAWTNCNLDFTNTTDYTQVTNSQAAKCICKQPNYLSNLKTCMTCLQQALGQTNLEQEAVTGWQGVCGGSGTSSGSSSTSSSSSSSSNSSSSSSSSSSKNAAGVPSVKVGVLGGAILGALGLAIFL